MLIFRHDGIDTFPRRIYSPEMKVCHKKCNGWQSMVVHSCVFSTWQTEVGELPHLWVQSGLYRTCLKRPKPIKVYEGEVRAGGYCYAVVRTWVQIPSNCRKLDTVSCVCNQHQKVKTGLMSELNQSAMISGFSERLCARNKKWRVIEECRWCPALIST